MGASQLTLLGTGNAGALARYNTCFLLRTPAHTLLVDGGGGNTILERLRSVGLSPTQVDSVFLTHAHSDHLLGLVWIVRQFLTAVKNGKYSGSLPILGHQLALESLKTVCQLTLSSKDRPYLEKNIEWRILEDGQELQLGDLHLLAFDIHSTKDRQFGFSATLPSGRKLVCLGDEPFNERNRPQVEGANYLLCEAFCLYKDRQIFKPYAKNHSTALDAGRVAQGLGVENLILYHTEDRTQKDRGQLYSAEAQESFKGRVWAPEDLESIPLE